MTRRLVVIGNGMAATRLVQRLVERYPARFAITVVGDEPHPAYNRIQLSPLLAGEKNGGADPVAAGGVVHPARGVPAVWRGGR
ncbi:hypothetical protein BHS30_18875 [Klebsiella pneumoniae]|nr:hypothetical protein BHS30_18875 [Klebsiella pneumoniae]